MAAPDAPQAAAKPEAAAAEAHGLSVSAQPGRLSTAYDVGKAVGKGGYAVVYKGVRKEDGRIIAVKKVEIFEMTQKKRERCLQEVTLLQQLTHPYIIQMLDAFIDENMLIIIFEWAPAGDLKRMIKKTAEAGKTFDETTIWTLFFQITDALRYMHQHRIMHRDIKPANVLVGANGALKIGDLGLGRQLSEQTMEAFSKVGTPYYVSPEVVRGAGYDWKSDVWSLGCLLYELACLHSPFEMEGANLYDVFQKISKGDYKRLPADTFSAPLRSLVERMLSVDPSQRPELEEVWVITQKVIQQTQTKTRTDVHSTSEELHSQLLLLEADVMHKVGRQNGKRVELPLPPTDALRQLHPLFFAEPLVQPSSPLADSEHKRQLGALMAIAAWLLRLSARPELASQVEGLLEQAPAPPSIRRRLGDPDGASPAAGGRPKPPSIKRSDSGSGSQRVRVSRWGATADAPGTPQPPAVAALAGSSSRAQSPSSPLRRQSSGSRGGQEVASPSLAPTPPATSRHAASVHTIPSCTNLLKGAEAVKKAAQALGLSTEFAPVNAVATGHGRAVCGILQGMLDVAWAKLAPAARKPRYHEDPPAAEQEGDVPEEEAGVVDGNDDDIITADHPLVVGSSGAAYGLQDDEDDEAYARHDAVVGAVLGAGAMLAAARSDSKGRGSGVTGSGATGRGSGPGRPLHNQQQVDPVAWRNEAERLAPVLSRITIPSGGAGTDAWADWHRRWGEFKGSAGVVTNLAPGTSAALAKARGVVETDLDRIATSERRLNGNAESLLEQYRTARQRQSETQRHLSNQEELQQAGNAALAELNARLEEVVGRMQDRAGNLDGGGQIQGIQTAIRRVRMELKQMELRIGVVQQQLLLRERRWLVSRGALSQEVSDDD